MAYFTTCPHCGANLDPGETCTCNAESEERRKKWESMTKESKNGQIVLLPEKETKERERR